MTCTNEPWLLEPSLALWFYPSQLWSSASSSRAGITIVVTRRLFEWNLEGLCDRQCHLKDQNPVIGTRVADMARGMFVCWLAAVSPSGRGRGAVLSLSPHSILLQFFSSQQMATRAVLRSLSADILMAILDNLVGDIKTLAHAGHVCRSWRDLSALIARECRPRQPHSGRLPQHDAQSSPLVHRFYFSDHSDSIALALSYLANAPFSVS